MYNFVCCVSMGDLSYVCNLNKIKVVSEVKELGEV